MRLAATISTILWSLLLCGSLLAAPQVEGNHIPDQDIADAIEDEYLFDLAIDFHKIDVTVTGGIAELEGKVDDLLAKERATYIAEQVKGVRSVSNRMSVEPAERRSNSELKRAINDALFKDPVADSYEIDVVADDGLITLTGVVESFAEKQLTAKVVKGVRGVTGIVNDIAIEYRANRPDSEIKPEIERKLRWDVLVNDGLVDVAVDNGKVTLTGTVGSAAEKRVARYSAWVSGVTSVDDSGLDVEWWANDEDLRKDKYVHKPDHEIAKAIKDAALFDPRVVSVNIDPDVQDGWVTLRGEVADLRARQATEDLAKNTIGVSGVTNLLKVRPIDRPTNVEVKNSVNTALFENPVTDSYDIDVTAYSGGVTLTGRVDSAYEKMEAGRVARRTSGVTQVHNYLDVSAGEAPRGFGFYYPWYVPTLSPRALMSDAAIADEIEDELWWSPFVDAGEVNVSVDDGVVTLTGEVDSYRESKAAVDNAYEGGAERVVNLLDVR